MNSIYIEIDRDSWNDIDFYSKSKKKIVTKKKIKQVVPQEFLNMKDSMDFEMTELLFHISDVTRNPFDYKMSLNNNWAFLRYINCFDSDKKLRLRREYEDVDPHQKTILSDDFGMGFASLFLDRTLKIEAIIDTHLFLKYLPHLKSSQGNKSGPSKSPDFIVFDSNGKLHLLECKGTQKSMTVSKSQLQHGLEQVDSIVDPNNIVNQRLVIGTYISRFNSKSSSTITVIDPDFPYNFKYTNKEELITLTMYFQMLKELSFVVNRDIILKFDEYQIDLKNRKNSLMTLSDLLKEIKKYYQADTIEDTFENEDFILKKSIDLNAISSLIDKSKNIDDFINKVSENKKKISASEYIGLFGLRMTLKSKKDYG